MYLYSSPPIVQAAIEKEVMDFLPRLQGGVAYYRPPSAAAEKRLRESGRVRSKNLPLVLDISSHLVGGACWTSSAGWLPELGFCVCVAIATGPGAGFRVV